MTEVEQKLTAINRDIEQLLHGLGQEGLLDDQFAQLMQLQASPQIEISVLPCSAERIAIGICVRGCAALQQGLQSHEYAGRQQS